MTNILWRTAFMLLGIAACSAGQRSLADTLLVSWVDAPAPEFFRVEAHHNPAFKFNLNFSGIATNVAIDRDGNFYVGAFASSDVHKYNSYGISQGVFATASPLVVGSMAFNSAGELITSAANLQASPITGSIERFAPNGLPLGAIATNVPGQHNDMAINAAGDIFLTTTGSSVQRFGSDGALRNTFSVGGRPSTLALDSQSTLYAVINNSSVAAFAPTGEPLGTIISGVGYIQSIAIDSNDNVYIGGGVEFESQGFIKTYSSSGAYIQDYLSGQPGIAWDLAFAMPVPEPGALAMCITLGGVVLSIRRRQQRVSDAAA